LNGTLAFELHWKALGVLMTAKSGKDSYELKCHHNVRVGNLSTTIHMRVYQRKSDGKLLIEQSHFIKTGIQYLPYAVNEMQGSDETAALHELEQNILNFYDQAVRRGYTPTEAWLIPNSSFQE
jgi:hypothetical protein